MGDRNSVPILKILVAIGVIVTTVGLIFFVNETISRVYYSFALQVVVSGVIVLAMSIAAIKIFRGLDHG